MIIGAVADGAGSAKYSDVGAELAVETALEYLSSSEGKKLIDLIDKESPSGEFLEDQESNLSNEKAKNTFKEAVIKAQKALQKKADEEGYSINELACTLLVFIATPKWIAAMQIGDGFIVVCPQDSKYKMLFKPDKGEFANETTFITSTNALKEMQVKVLREPQHFICASTDGLEKVAIHFSDWSPYPPFFKPLQQYISNLQEDDDEYLKDFLDLPKLNARTNDDKTLLLCLYQSEGIDEENDTQEESPELQNYIDQSSSEQINSTNIRDEENDTQEESPELQNYIDQSSSEQINSANIRDEKNDTQEESPELQTNIDNSATEETNPGNASLPDETENVEMQVLAKS